MIHFLKKAFAPAKIRVYSYRWVVIQRPLRETSRTIRGRKSFPTSIVLRVSTWSGDHFYPQKDQIRKRMLRRHNPDDNELQRSSSSLPVLKFKIFKYTFPVGFKQINKIAKEKSPFTVLNITASTKSGARWRPFIHFCWIEVAHYGGEPGFGASTSEVLSQRSHPKTSRLPLAFLSTTRQGQFEHIKRERRSIWELTRGTW